MIKAILKLTFGIILGFFSIGLVVMGGASIYGVIKSSQNNNFIGLVIFFTIFLLFAAVGIWGSIKLLKSFSVYVKSAFPVETHESGMNYAGFQKRLFASFIDFLILLPLMVLPYLITFRSKAMYLILIGGLIPLFYYIYTIGLEGYRGQTVGKLISKVKITALNGNRAGYTRALKRSLVNIFSSVIYFVLIFMALHDLSVNDFSGISYYKAPQLIHVENKSFLWPQIFTFLWMLSEFFALNFNRKRRALHDFIAGTIVLESNFNDKKQESLIPKEILEEGRP